MIISWTDPSPNDGVIFWDLAVVGVAEVDDGAWWNIRFFLMRKKKKEREAIMIEDNEIISVIKQFLDGEP